MDQIECVIIGAGVVGLAIARALAFKGREVLILDSERASGSVTSSRNSGVIHAGLYYRPGSLKAQACVTGREKLYAYCAERGITHVNCGKFVVAAHPAQIPALHDIQTNAEFNGIHGMELLSAEEARKFEPELVCAAALHVPVTGMIEVHEYMQALLGDAESRGATLALNAPVLGGEVSSNAFTLDIGGEHPTRIACRTLINAAGLGAQDVGRSLRGLDPATVPPQVLGKGSYFTLGGPLPFKKLIYPLPVLGSLGLHYSYDFGHQMRFGPDIEWVDHIDYHVDPARAVLFEDSIRQYWPKLPLGALQPAYAGVRPKLSRSSPHDSDFVIQTAKDHGISGLINLYGIESPGLTSSLALADIVEESLFLSTPRGGEGSKT